MVSLHLKQGGAAEMTEFVPQNADSCDGLRSPKGGGGRGTQTATCRTAAENGRNGAGNAGHAEAGGESRPPDS